MSYSAEKKENPYNYVALPVFCKITKLNPFPKNPKCLATGYISVGNCFIISDVKIWATEKGGYFVSYPSKSYKDAAGNTQNFDLVKCTSKAMAFAVHDQFVEAYEKEAGINKSVPVADVNSPVAPVVTEEIDDVELPFPIDDGPDI